MKQEQDIFEKIRITPRGAKKKEDKTNQKCAWEGCEKPGNHRAPLGRNNGYVNFCMEHVRQYNKSFNYFAGMSDEQIAKIQKENVTGNRPTWKISARSPGEPVDESTLRATPQWHADVRTRYTADGKRIGGSNKQERKLKKMEQKALRDLGLPDNATKEQITKKYRELVKKHHPDANEGDRSSEQRLQQILSAYKQLQKAKLC